MLSEIKKFNKPPSFRTRGKLKYSSKSYHNPFFPKKSKSKKNIKKKIKLSLKAKIIFILFAISILSLIWFLFYSQFFMIEKFEIKGGGMIAENDLHEYAEKQIQKNFWVFMPQKNIFFFDKKALKSTLEEKYSFNSLSIHRKLPRTIKINYAEKKYKMIWKIGDSYAYADQTGYVLSDLNILDAKLKDYPIVENLDDSKDNLQTKLNFIFLLFSEFKKHEDYAIEKFILDKESGTVKIDLIEGPEIYFNINKSINSQIKKLLIIREEKIKDDFSQKTYIDLRLGDSVYFR